MKLFQRLLVAPAALGLMAPVAVSAAELNINEVSTYSPSRSSRAAKKKRVKSITQFSDVYPTDWAHQALSKMLERNGCAPLGSSGSMTRYEAAVVLNKCLGNVSQANEEERRLINEFAAELAVIKGRLDGVEAGIGFEPDGFSTTTKMGGSTVFVVGAVERGVDSTVEATTFSYHTNFDLETSFSGDDLLVTTVEAGNFNANNPFVGDTALESGYSSGNRLQVERSFYTTPIGNDFTVTAGMRVRQDDMLGVWPSAYPTDTVLDVLTYAGANDTYALALGAGAGVTYAHNNISASVLWVGDEADSSNPLTGGAFTTGGSDDFTAQFAWVDEALWIDRLTLATAVTYSDGGVGKGTANANHYTAYALSGYYEINKDASLWPSTLSAGVGFKTPETESETRDIEDETTWSFGFIWNDVGVDGNNLGVAFGTAEGHRQDSGYDHPKAYEIFYSMAVSDSITVTPAFFVVEQSGESDDYSGGLVKTTFNF